MVSVVKTKPTMTRLKCMGKEEAIPISILVKLLNKWPTDVEEKKGK